MDMQNLLHNSNNRDTLDVATVSVEQAKRFADHYLALAQYWRQVAKLPPVNTGASERRLRPSETGHR